MKKIELKDRQRTFLDLAMEAINQGREIVAVEAEQCELSDGSIESGWYLLHGLDANDDSIVVFKEQHPGKTSEEVEAEYAAEIASYLQFTAAVQKAFIGLG